MLIVELSLWVALETISLHRCSYTSIDKTKPNEALILKEKFFIVKGDSNSIWKHCKYYMDATFINSILFTDFSSSKAIQKHRLQCGFYSEEDNRKCPASSPLAFRLGVEQNTDGRWRAESGELEEKQRNGVKARASPARATGHERTDGAGGGLLFFVRLSFKSF